MDDLYPFCSMSIGLPIPEIMLFQNLTSKLHGQGHGCDQRSKSYSQPSILSLHFLFISHKSDQHFLRYSYFEIWPWSIQGQSHEWGQRSRSHIIPSIQQMHFIFNSHQSDQPFLRYGKIVVGLLPSGNKKLSEPAMTKISATTWRDYSTMIKNTHSYQGGSRSSQHKYCY